MTTSEDSTIEELHVDEMAEREMRKREIAMTKCPACGRAVTVWENRLYQCNCGRGTLRPLPDNKIRWLSEDEAMLALSFSGNHSRFDDSLKFVLMREV